MRMLGTAALTLGLWAAQAQADDVSWRPVTARTPTQTVAAAPGVAVVTLGRPVVSLGQPTASEVTPVSYNPDATTPQPIIRAQAPDGPPPVPAPGAPATPLYQAPPPPPPPGPTSIYQPPPPPVSIGTPYVGDERYNQGLVTDPTLAPGPGGRHPFWGKVCDTCGLDQFESRKRFQTRSLEKAERIHLQGNALERTSSFLRKQYLVLRPAILFETSGLCAGY